MSPAALPIRIACAVTLAVLTGLQPAHAEETRPKSKGAFLFQWDNDKVADTDRHYTNGMRIAYTLDHPDGQWLTTGGWWADRTWFQDRAPLRVGWVLGQDMFTPEDVDSHTPDPLDRPYAGWSYIGLSAQAESDALQDTVEADIGIIGPGSKAAQTQNAFHRLINVSVSRGWRHQIHNEVGLLLTRTRKVRSTPLYASGEYGADLVGHGRAQLGNVRTGAAVGATLRIGRNLDRDFGPVYGGGALPQNRPDRPTYSLFLGGEAQAVLWDVFLDGNTFRDSPGVDKKPAVLEARAGFTVHWPVDRWGVQGLRTSINIIHRTREFETQDKADRYGSLQVSVNF